MNKVFGYGPARWGGTAANVQKFRNQFNRRFRTNINRLDER